jgi:hypothetical protein
LKLAGGFPNNDILIRISCGFADGNRSVIRSSVNEMGSRIGWRVISVNEMGSRIGWRVIKGEEKSDILRQQWKSSLSKGLEGMWANLSDGKPVGDGSGAIRDDLDCSRAFAALVAAVYSKPYNSIEKDINCDIDNNGLVEIDIEDFKCWKVYIQDLGVQTQIGDWDWGALGQRHLVAQMSPKGFEYLKTDEEMDKIGEGGWT